MGLGGEEDKGDRGQGGQRNKWDYEGEVVLRGRSGIKRVKWD